MEATVEQKVESTAALQILDGDDGKRRFEVAPFVFDPGATFLVQSMWLTGIGCPTNAKTFDGTMTGSFTDSACPSGDRRDRQNEGLLLVKTGPTTNFAAAGAELNGVKGIMLTELGYDIRKLASTASPTGSHCGAGAPRFNVTTMDDVTHFVGCNSPAPLQTASLTGWIRLRWDAPLLLAAFPPILPTDVVKAIDIIFDEGQDTGPDFFGAAIIDNIDVNGVLVGQGPEDERAREDDRGRGDDRSRGDDRGRGDGRDREN